MNIGKTSPEFEEWFKERFWHECYEDVKYHLFAAWQASRESLVIELPDDGIEDCRKEWPERGEKYGYDTFDTGYLYACKKHEEAIEAAGLKVKS